MKVIAQKNLLRNKFCQNKNFHFIKSGSERNRKRDTNSMIPRSRRPGPGGENYPSRDLPNRGDIPIPPYDCDGKSNFKQIKRINCIK
jgi:hypothetical protein